MSASRPIKALQRSISPERLSRYLQASNGDFDAAMAAYERNMRLSEAFYTPLQCLEVCLRNRMHERLSVDFGREWYELSAAGLDTSTQIRIADAKYELTQVKASITPGAMVAELSFGTWVGLLGPHYDGTLWRTTFWKAFAPNGKGMKRKVVHGRINMLRRFRNRVAHHEPIFNRDLASVHSELIEAIEWMCPLTAKWTNSLSRVMSIWGETVPSAQDTLQARGNCDGSTS
jgi:hypothetical protein